MQHQVDIFEQQLQYEKVGIWRYCGLWKLEVACHKVEWYAC